MYYLVDYATWDDCSLKKIRKRKQMLGSWQKAEKDVGLDGVGDTNCSLCPWNSSQNLEKNQVELWIWEKIDTI